METGSYNDEFRQEIRQLRAENAALRTRVDCANQHLNLATRQLASLVSTIERINHALNPQEPFVFGWNSDVKTNT